MTGTADGRCPVLKWRGDLGLVANELVNPWILEQINYRQVKGLVRCTQCPFDFERTVDSFDLI